MGAQLDNQIFESITTEHGLSSNKVEAVIQDKDGFYWIATQNGLNRFDGSTFKIFRHDPGDSTSLSHNYCTSVAEDLNGDIWVATYKGVSRFKKRTGTFQRIYLQHPTRNFELTNRIYNILADNEGNIWIGGRSIWKYDLQSGNIILLPQTINNTLKIPGYTSVKQLVYDDLNALLWFTTDHGLVAYSNKKGEYYYDQNNPQDWQVFSRADNLELTMDSRGRLWFRDKISQNLGYFDSPSNSVTLTNKKIHHGIKQLSVDEKDRLWIFYWQHDTEIYNPDEKTLVADFLKPFHQRSAVSSTGNCLFIDREGNYWIGSGNGISVYKRSNQFFSIHKLEKAGSNNPSQPITAIAQSNPGQLWIATQKDLFLYDLGNRQAKPFRLNIKGITTLLADGDKIWIGDYDHLLCFDINFKTITQRFRLKPGIFFIRKDYKGYLWIGLWDGGLFQFDPVKQSWRHHFKNDSLPSSPKSDNLITGLAIGENIWTGYNAGIGFSRYSLSGGRWEHFHPHGSDIKNSNAGTVTVITPGSSNVLWLGTHGSGIFKYDVQSNLYENIDQFKGLNSNYINSIIPDQYGNLWISTADGINYLNVEKNTVRNLDVGMVFADNDFKANGIRGVDNKLYFFCNNEFIEIDPAAYAVSPAAPHIVINSFKIFDKEFAINKEDQPIKLTHRQNFFTFQFSEIKSNPSKYSEYAYKLEGFDRDWNNSRRGVANYTNVPGGDFRFLVKARNSDGEWSDVLLSIPIVVYPPFWNTWWFISLAALLLLGVAYSIHRYRIAQVKKIISVRTQISRDLHDDIGASLSSINIYSNLAESEVAENPQRAKEILNQISTNSREVMENISDIVWANHVNRHQGASLEGRIKNYGYDLLSQKNIDCEYLIDPNVEKKLSKPEARRNILLIIKEALNNIAKYSEASEASLLIRLNGQGLNITISDNGKGFERDKATKGNGLLHMEQRAAALGGKLTIHSEPDQGTLIEATIPLANISD